MTITGYGKISANYYPGIGCRCAASDQSECGCDADWTPRAERLLKSAADMPHEEMVRRFGEMTPDEFSAVKNVLIRVLEDASGKLYRRPPQE